jgi:hypothetical protein
MACITNEPVECEIHWLGFTDLGFHDGSVLMLIPIFRLCSAYVGSVADISETHAASTFSVGGG